MVLRSFLERYVEYLENGSPPSPYPGRKPLTSSPSETLPTTEEESDAAEPQPAVHMPSGVLLETLPTIGEESFAAEPQSAGSASNGMSLGQMVHSLPSPSSSSRETSRPPRLGRHIGFTSLITEATDQRYLKPFYVADGHVANAAQPPNGAVRRLGAITTWTSTALAVLDPRAHREYCRAQAYRTSHE